MSFLDDLFTTTDNTTQVNEWLWRKAVVDAINAEYPDIQNWLQGGYDQAINATNAATQNQINTLSMVPEMSYNVMGSGINFAENRLLGAPGSAINAPQYGYPVPSYNPFYGAPQGYNPYSTGGGFDFSPAAMSNPLGGYQPYQPYQLPVQAPIAAPVPVQQPIQAPVQQPIPVQQPVAAAVQAPIAAPVQFPLSGTQQAQSLSPLSGAVPTRTAGDYTAAQGSLGQRIEAVRSPFATMANRGPGGTFQTHAYNPDNTAAIQQMYQGMKQYGISPYDPEAIRVFQGLGVDISSGIPTENIQSLNAFADRHGLDFSYLPETDKYWNYQQRLTDSNQQQAQEALGPRNNVIDDPNWISPQDLEYQRKYQLGQFAPDVAPSQQEPEQTADDYLPPEARRDKSGVMSYRTPQDASLAAQYDAQMNTPVQAPVAPTSTYSPLQAAIDATRSELQQNPGNQFAQQKLDEMLAQQAPQMRDMSNVTQSALSMPAGTATQTAPQTMTPDLQSAINNYLANPSVELENQVRQIATNQGATPDQLSSMTGGQFSTADAAAWLGNTQAGEPNQVNAPTANTATTQPQFPWQGVQTFDNAPAGTGLQGSNSTLNQTLGSANTNLLNAGQNAVNAIGFGRTTGDIALQGALAGGTNAISSGANMGRNDLYGMADIGFGGLQPYQQTGNLATAQMGALTGLNGIDAQRSAIQNVMASPEFDFYREQGNQSVLRNAAALGGLGGGNVMKELSRFNQGLASTQFQNYYDRLSPLAGQGLQAAGTAAGLSGQFGGDLARLGLGAGTAAGSLYGGIGQARARNDLSAALGAADTIMGTGSQQAANTMGIGQTMGGNQMNVGSQLGNYGFTGANVLAGQYPGLAQTAAGAYGNQGALLSNLYTGLGGALSGNAWNRANLAAGFGAYSPLQTNPGMLQDIGALLSGGGNLLTGLNS